MEPRVLAAAVSCLVSQALLLLVLSSLPLTPLPTDTDTDSTADLLLPFSPFSSPTPPSHRLLAPFLLHLLSSSQLAVSARFLSRHAKRQKTHRGDDADGTDEAGEVQDAAIVVPHYPDHFRICFRMSAATFEWLLGLLDPLLLLDCCNPAGPRTAPSLALAVAVARLASGSPYPDLARRFGVTERAARFFTKRLCRVLCTNFRFYLAFPSSPPDLLPISAAFRSLPGCCGALSCTRFDAPIGTVAAQIVADASARILSIAAGFRGDRTDFAVLRRSSLCKDLQGGRLLGSTQYLVGDGPYPLLPWLMVPFASADRGSDEEGFNAVHRSLCRPVRRVLASLRNWGVLRRLAEEEDPKVAAACIGTCAILHNVLLMRDDYSALSDAGDAEPELELGSEERCYIADTGMDDFDAERSKALLLRRTLAVSASAVAGSR